MTPASSKFSLSFGSKSFVRHLCYSSEPMLWHMSPRRAVVGGQNSKERGGAIFEMGSKDFSGQPR